MPEPSSSAHLTCVCGSTRFYHHAEGMHVVEVWFKNTENKNLNDATLVNVYEERQPGEYYAKELICVLCATKIEMGVDTEW